MVTDRSGSWGGGGAGGEKDFFVVIEKVMMMIAELHFSHNERCVAGCEHTQH